MTARDDVPHAEPWGYGVGTRAPSAAVRRASARSIRDGGAPELLLSERERDILRLVAHGYSNIQISLELNLAEKTVRNQVCEIYASLGVNTRVLAVRWALRAGLASLSPSPVEQD